MDNRLRDLRREAEALLERIAAAEVATPGLLRPVADVQELAGHYVLEDRELPASARARSRSTASATVSSSRASSPRRSCPRVKIPMGMRGVNPSSSMTPVSYQCLERQYGPFRRIFSLPGPCDLSQSRAELSGGILTRDHPHPDRGPAQPPLQHAESPPGRRRRASTAMAPGTHIPTALRTRRRGSRCPQHPADLSHGVKVAAK